MKKTLTLIVLIFLLAFSGCTTLKFDAADSTKQITFYDRPGEKVFFTDKSRSIFLLGGLFPILQPDVATIASEVTESKRGICNLKITTIYTWQDVLVNILTLGIIHSKLVVTEGYALQGEAEPSQ